MTKTRRPGGKRRGRGASGKGHAAAPPGNTTDVIGVGATVADVIAVNSTNDVIQVGA